MTNNHFSEESEDGLKFALIITTSILAIQLIGFYLSNSLSLLGDTGHVFSDLLAFIASFAALKISMRSPTPRRTFGFHRAEVFSALFNGILLFFMALVLLWEAMQRLAAPPIVFPVPMFITALIGLIGNLLVVKRLEQNENLNVRSAFMHAVGDAVSSIGVIIGAVAIMITGMQILDLLISTLTSVIIMTSSYRLIRSSLSILFESAPREASPDVVSKVILGVEDVQDVHDVHVWSVCSDVHYVTAHVVLRCNESISKSRGVITKVNKELERRLGITHATLQIEDMKCNGETCEHWH